MIAKCPGVDPKRRGKICGVQHHRPTPGSLRCWWCHTEIYICKEGRAVIGDRCECGERSEMNCKCDCDPGKNDCGDCKGGC
jgi:hypothetical protein